MSGGITTYPRRAYRLRRFSGVVTHVCDGDTVDIKVSFGWFGRRTETLRIRFAGMDTPEMTGKTTHRPENYAYDAKHYVMRKTLNKHVTVEIAVLKGSGQFITGAHGRVIGVLYASWVGPSLNVVLVRRGLAKVYPRSMCSWMTDALWRQLTAAERYAKRKRLKIWSVPRPRKSHYWALMLAITGGVCAILLFLMGGRN